MQLSKYIIVKNLRALLVVGVGAVLLLTLWMLLAPSEANAQGQKLNPDEAELEAQQPPLNRDEAELEAQQTQEEYEAERFAPEFREPTRPEFVENQPQENPGLVVPVGINGTGIPPVQEIPITPAVVEEPVEAADDSGGDTASPGGLASSCSGKSCSACDLVDLANSVIKWLIGILFLLFAIITVVAGFGLVTSGGNPGALQDAKKKLLNGFIGIVIVLASWLLVDTMMRGLLGEDGTIKGYGPWAEIKCGTQTEPGINPNLYADVVYPDVTPRATASGDNASTLNSGQVQGRVVAIKNTPEVTRLSDAALDRLGITDPAQRKHFRALISQESSNCTNKLGPDTGSGRGRAYGCVQMLIGTAREVDAKMDRRFVGKNDAVVAQELQNNNAYNMVLGAYYFKEGIQKYNSIDSALARYNGGDGAMRRSKDCPGQTYYQCTANQGYAQTRHYVSNIKALAAGI